MRLGDKPKRPVTLESAGEIAALDEESRTVELKLGPSRLGAAVSLIPEGPVGDAQLRAAVYRFAESAVALDGRYSALRQVLRRDLPRLRGVPAGTPVVDSRADPVLETCRALAALEEGCLLVQGPPGAGKTYTASRAIVELLGAGKRVGVASN